MSDRAERLDRGSGWEGSRRWPTGAHLSSASASTSGACPAWVGRRGSAATPSRPSVDAERGSLPASRLCAWARRNSDQLGPIRRGAGARPALRNSVATVVAETMIPSPFSSPWIRI
jgi:hypothetical protein